LQRGGEQPRRAGQFPRAARRDEVREGQGEEAGTDEVGDAAQAAVQSLESREVAYSTNVLGSAA
jgi:hypothetical protein